MNPLAQQETASGANPAVQIPGDMGGAMSPKPSDKQMEELFRKIARTPVNQKPALAEEVKNTAESFDGDIKAALEVLANSLTFNSDPRKLSRRWVTVQEAINDVKTKMKTQPEEPKTAPQQGSAAPQQGGALQPLASRQARSLHGGEIGHNALPTQNFAAPAKHQGAPAKKQVKKKTRGNPFRVLMGKVGKLLDHGASDHDIVRFLLKDGIFDEKTIRKSIEIVKDYNKKKHVHDGVDEADTDTNPFYHKAGTPFNFAKLAARENTGEANSLYDAKPDFNFRSTSELFARLRWLESLMAYGAGTPQGDGKAAADKTGASSQISDIKKALRARGFEDEFIKAKHAK